MIPPNIFPQITGKLQTGEIAEKLGEHHINSAIKASQHHHTWDMPFLIDVLRVHHLCNVPAQTAIILMTKLRQNQSDGDSMRQLSYILQECHEYQCGGGEKAEEWWWIKGDAKIWQLNAVSCRRLDPELLSSISILACARSFSGGDHNGHSFNDYRAVPCWCSPSHL